MADVIIRTEGRAGHITLNRPDALNALTHQMCLQIEAALHAWSTNADVNLVILDAAGDRAFCSGGDIAEMYATGSAGDYAYGRQFWQDEYRLNAMIAHYPKPVVSFLQGFTMGGGVGVGCHGTHRIVGESSQIAMPEVGIGLVPDVGGSMILANAPGRLGEYLGTTATRMGPEDAIYAGFADLFVPEAAWDGLKDTLTQSGDTSVIYGQTPPRGKLKDQQEAIDWPFAGQTLSDILRVLENSDTDLAASALKALRKHAPLSMACAIEMIHRLRGNTEILRALDLEYRFTFRAMEHGDFIEGIRAMIIDKDRTPNWRHDLQGVPPVDVSRMLMPLGKDALDLRKEPALKIGFIGLGNMGAPMAANLSKAGYDVTGFDTAVAPDGLTMASSVAEAAQGADVVITMLPNGPIVRAVAAEALPSMKKDAILLDCSTIDVESARAVAAQASEAGCAAVDAPVSGGIGGAAAGTLTFMAGGPEAAFEAVSPLFEVMGQKAVHCGDAGNGQAAKICNNMILGITMIGTCEAFALADKLGLDRQAMFDVVSTSSGYSWTMNAYCPAPGVGPASPADKDYKPGFAAELMLKDLGLSQQAAEAADADTPLGAAAQELYRRFVEDEGGEGLDFSAMLKRFEARGRG